MKAFSIAVICGMFALSVGALIYAWLFPPKKVLEMDSRKKVSGGI